MTKADNPLQAEGAPAAEAWRPEVRAFADLMEAKLRANDHKPGWKNDHPLDLHRRLREEVAELGKELVQDFRVEGWPPGVAHEAADVANFAMMIADVCGAPSLPALSPPAAEPVPVAWGYTEILPGRTERSAWRVTASVDQAEMLREAGIEVQPLYLGKGASS